MDVRTTPGTQSLDRLFQIIEAMSLSPKGIALADLCADTGLPKSTVSRMLSALVAHSYAMQDPDSKRYRLTTRLFEIGCRVAGSSNILTIARPYMESLSSRTGEVVHLVSRVDDDVIYLHKEEPVSSIAAYMSSYVGRRNAMYCTGVGKCILAYLSEAEFQAYWARITPTPFTPHTITAFSVMQGELLRIRERGYAIDNEEHEPGIRCIAAPILDYNENPVAAISLSASVSHLDDAHIADYAPLLLDVTHNISRYYGR